MGKDRTEQRREYEKQFHYSVKLRLTKEQYSIINSKKGDLSIAKYMLGVTLKSKTILKSKDLDKIQLSNDILLELNRIGNNVNQLTRNLNILMKDPRNDLSDTLKTLESIMPIYGNVLEKLMQK